MDDFLRERLKLADHMKTVLKQSNGTKYCKLSGSLQKIQRIGTKSVYGQVFLVSESAHPQHLAAAKIMYDTKDNARELEWYKKFERVVRKGQSPHFPLVYHQRICGKCPFDKDAPAKPGDASKPRCIVAVSELAAGDLKAWMAKGPRSPAAFASLVAQIVMALYELELHGALHNDLHWGNLLYLETNGLKGKWITYKIGQWLIEVRNEGFLWLLWDFGKMKSTRIGGQVIQHDLYRIMHFAEWAEKDGLKTPKLVREICRAFVQCAKKASSWDGLLADISAELTPPMWKLINRVVRMRQSKDGK